MSELEQNRENQKQNPHTIPMLVAAIISIIYFLALGFLLTRIQHCPPVYNVTEFEITLAFDWFYQKIHCRSFNELGDFLAGAFAPVAFLWLVAAVFIQSRELAAQRQELEFTRDEAMLMREEVNASVKQMTEQTAVMQHEREDRERKHNKEVCDALFKRITKIGQKTNWSFTGDYIQSKTGSRIIGTPNTQWVLPEATNIDELVNSFNWAINELNYEKKKWTSAQQTLENTHFPNNQLAEIVNLIEKIQVVVFSQEDTALGATFPPRMLQNILSMIDEIENAQDGFLNGLYRNKNQ